MIVRSFHHKGYQVRECRYDPPLAFLPATYFTCPTDELSRWGTGRTADEAVNDMLGKRERIAA